MIKKSIIVDIDNTVSVLPQDRQKVLDTCPIDWQKYYSLDFSNDKPIMPIIDLIKNYTYCFNYRIVFCTARREHLYETTYRWIIDNFKPFNDPFTLLMRPETNNECSAILKLSLLKQHFDNDFSSIVFAIDDHYDVVSAYKKAGILSLQIHIANT